ncbi:hypothetical protein Dimus_016351 [Dionaea muscipula]
MGFRFFNCRPIFRICFFSNVYCSRSYRSLISHPHNPLPIRAPAAKLLEISISNDIYTSSYVIFKRWHIGHSHDHHHHHHGGGRQGPSNENEDVFRLGLAADIGLAVGKAVTGYLSGSTAIIADAAHSLSDVVLSGVALLSYKAARAPKDKEHPYGHGKFETLGALGISCMLIATAGGIAWHAIVILQDLFSSTSEIASLTHDHTHHGHHHKIDLDHPVLALNMTILSIAIKEGLFWITKRAGEKEGSGLMKANAWHHRADAVSSFVALLGVGGSILGLKFLDPLAGLVVSVLILKAGLETGYESIMELVDAAVPQSLLDPYRETILKVEGVMGCHRLRARRAGSFLYLDVHIEVDPFSSISVAHHVGEIVRNQIHESHPEVAEVFIHIDPATVSVSPAVVDLKEESVAADHQTNAPALQALQDADNIVSFIFHSNFLKKMAVLHITRHLLQGKILLEIEVSMPPDLLIRDAMVMAESARKAILDTVPDVSQVKIQLRLLPQNHMFST